MSANDPLAPEHHGQVAAFHQPHRTELVTLVFTDIVGSTALKQQLGDKAGAALMQQHHALVREVFQPLTDAEEISTAGDSFLIRFAKPSDAVKFALLLQSRLRAFNQGREVAVQDRIGVHLGEVVVAEEQAVLKPRDVYGMHVDTCARVMSLAAGGQILLTRAVFDSARQALKGEDIAGVAQLNWLNHGLYQLRGIEEAVEVCEVGEVGAGPLRSPATTEKARRVEAAEGEAVVGWRPAVGQAVPNTQWVLEQKLGEGGFGEVWLGRHQAMKERRVFKFCFRADRVRSLKREMTLFRLIKERIGDHPNIVSLREVFFNEPPYYVEMDYVAGQDLRAWCEAQGGAEKVPLEVKLDIVAQIADALQAAHEAGVIHRDVKPANILVSGQNEQAGSSPAVRYSPLSAKLTDFGIGQVVSEEALKGVTRAGFTQTIVADSSSSHTGSQLYMAPELLAGKPASTRSDIYSLGVVLYQLLIGDFGRPVAGDWSEDIPDPLLRDDLKHCLAGKREDRFAGAEQLAKNLRAYAQRKAELERQEAEAAERERLKERAELRRKVALVSSVVALLLVVIAVALGYGLRRAEKAEQRAIAEREHQRSLAYAADMNLAQQAWSQNNLGRASGLLDRHRPKAGEKDLRGWEWRYLWQLCRGDELFTLHQYPRPVCAVAVSKDGKVLALSYWDQVALWDLTAKQPLTALPISATEALAFSPTGNLLAVGTTNATGQPGVDFWDVSASKVTKTLTREAEIRSVAFSPDGKLLATFDNQGHIKLADWASDRTRTNFTVRQPRRRPAGVVVFSPDGNRLAIGEDYGHIQLLDLWTGTVVPFQTQSSEGVTALVFSANAKLLAAGLGSAVRLWDANSGESRGQLTNHTDEVSALAFTPDSRQLASASGDGTIRIWSVADHTEVRCFRTSRDGGLTALAMLPDGRTLVTGSDGGSVCLWNATASSRAPAHTNWAVAFGFDAFAGLDAPSFKRERLDPRAVRRLGFAFTPDSRSFITTDRYGSLALWDAQSVRVTENLPALGGNHWDVALSADGRWLAAGNASGILTIWDWTARRAVTNFTVPCELYGQLGFSRSGNFLFAVTANNEWRVSTRIWQTGDWEEVTLTGNQFAGLGSMDLSPDDRLLAAGFASGAVRLFRFPSGQHETTLTNHQAAVTGVLFSPDGRGLFSTSFDRSAKLWDVFARRELATLRGHFGIVYSPVLSPDGVRLATGGTSPKDAVKLWDLVAYRELLSLQGEGQYFMHLAFSPDGNTLVAISLDGVANLWRAPPWAEIEAIEKDRTRER